MSSKFLIGVVVLVGVGIALLDMGLRVEYPVPERGNAILITGCSSGLGLDAAQSLAKTFVVYAGVRKEKDAEKLDKLGIENLVPVIMDVTDQNSIESTFEFVVKDLKKRGGIHLVALVNNAGVGHNQVLEATNIEDVEYAFNVNVFGIFRVTKKFLPLLRAAKGRIINIGSLAGKAARPSNAVYSGTKYALEAITDSLRRELRVAQVSVSLVQPGRVVTEMTKASNSVEPEQDLPRSLLPVYQHVFDWRNRKKKGEIMATAEETTTEAIVHAITARYPYTRYPVAGFSGIPASLIVLATSLFPDRMVDLFFQ